MELISREEAMRLLKEDYDASRSREDDERAEACLLHLIDISNLPVIEERKEGEWVKNEHGLKCCSVCRKRPLQICYYDINYDGYTGKDILSNYCPNCGARIRGE